MRRTIQEEGRGTRTLHEGRKWLVAALAVVGLGAGCGDTSSVEGLLEEELATREQSLFGALEFRSSCASDERTLITNAVQHLRDTVVTSGFRQCIQDSMPIDDAGRMAEELVAYAQTGLNVVFDCKDRRTTSCGGSNGWAGCAGIIGSGDPESMMLDHDSIRSYSTESLAGVILHEILHNHAFWHHHGVGYATNNTAQECAAWGHPGGFRRNELGGDVAMAHVGGASGSGVEYRCGWDYMATGIRLAADTQLTRFGLECSKEENEALVYGYGVGSGAPAGSTVNSTFCPSGQALVGITGYADGFVQRVAPVCAPLPSLKGTFSYSLYTGSAQGNVKGRSFTRTCPDRKVVVGFRGMQGALIDRLELICDDVLSTSAPTVSLTATAGGTGGTTFVPRQCEGHGVMTGLFGWTTGTSYVRTLGGFCAPMVAATVLSSSYNSDRDFRLDPVGGTSSQSGDTHFAAPCTAGDVMVGVTGRADTLVRGVQPVCARVANWFEPGGSGATYVAAGGSAGSTGTSYSLMCDKGKAAVGFSGRDGDLVDMLRLRCAEPQSGVQTTSPLALAGGSGGVAVDIRCPNGPLTGLNYRVDGGPVVAVGGLCGRSIGNKLDASVRTQQPLYGGKKGNAALHSCANGYAMVGVHGRSNSLIQQLGAICQDIDMVKAKLTGSTVKYALVGNADSTQGTAFERRCLPGEVVYRINARTGARVDAMQLFCGPPDLVPGDTFQGYLSGSGKTQVLRIGLPADRTSLRVRMTPAGGADFDLYLRRQVAPTRSHYDVRGYNAGAGVIEDISMPTSGGLVHGDHYYLVVDSWYGSGSYTLEVL